MITFIKELNKAQIAGIIITIIASIYALINENDTLDTIAGVITAIGVSLLILGKSSFKKQTDWVLEILEIYNCKKKTYWNKNSLKDKF